MNKEDSPHRPYAPTEDGDTPQVRQPPKPKVFPRSWTMTMYELTYETSITVSLEDMGAGAYIGISQCTDTEGLHKVTIEGHEVDSLIELLLEAKNTIEQQRL